MHQSMVIFLRVIDRWYANGEHTNGPVCRLGIECPLWTAGIDKQRLVSFDNVLFVRRLNMQRPVEHIERFDLKWDQTTSLHPW